MKVSSTFKVSLLTHEGLIYLEVSLLTHEGLSYL